MEKDKLQQFKERMRSGRFRLDGAMGTMLQRKGLPVGQQPELFNLTHPELVTAVHRDYISAGADAVYTNTFGANEHKLRDSGYTVEQVVSAAVENAKRAAEGTSALVALDIGPIGELLEPTGNLSFEEAYRIVRRQVEQGITSGVDLIVLETMSDLYEVKAALLAVKEACADRCCPLPVLVTMTFEKNHRTFTGCSIPSMALTLGGLGADAIGFNCSLGPAELLPMAEELCGWTSLPIVIKPNAGLPDPLTNQYDITPEQFAREMEPFARMGISILGGCCGTDPEYLSSLYRMLETIPPVSRKAAGFPYRKRAAVCSPAETVEIDRVRIIGERINPTGKKRMKQALLEKDMDFILNQGITQVEAGAAILDVNMGLPEIDEAAMLALSIKRLQSILTAPLQIDSSHPQALEAALRVYNGKPIVNSVNGEPAVLDRILPLVKKYGAAVVGLTLDEKGIPLTAEERFAVAERIVQRAEEYGIRREDVFIDCLTLTASVQQKEVMETLKAVKMVKERLGVKTVLGVSNISFGLPNRELINHSFLLMALQAGLDLPIINPNVGSMMDAVRAFAVLSNQDTNAAAFIETYKDLPQTPANGGTSAKPSNPVRPEQTSETQREKTAETGRTKADEIGFAIEKGMEEAVRQLTSGLIEQTEPDEIINHLLIPALDRVGQKFETGEIFLPQMIQSAQAAQAAFEVIKNFLTSHSNGGPAINIAEKGIVLATVKGDIHDIGKNIVKVILENYGYPIIDLGRDVPAEAVVEAVERTGVRLVGLSALMTTTLKSMEETIAALRAKGLGCQVMVGGAVLTPDYADKIGADFYAKDAKQSVDIARKVLGA